MARFNVTLSSFAHNQTPLSPLTTCALMYGPDAPNLQLFPGGGFLLTLTVIGLRYLLTCFQQNIPVVCSVTAQVTRTEILCFVLIWLEGLNYILLYHDKEYLGK